MSGFLAAGYPASSAAAHTSPPAAPPVPPLPPGAGGEPSRNGAVLLLAGVGLLLLAMGIGVLIGRSGASSGRTPPPEVVTVGSSAATASTPTEESFTSDWPAGKKGWTVELQTLPESSTPAQVTAAKTAASSKGAKSVGALKAQEFPSVGGSGFVVYSGDYSSKAQAQHAAAALKKSFPGAKAVDVAGESSSEPASKLPASSTGGNKPSAPSSLSKPARLQPHATSHGQQYEKESSKLPEVVETP